MVARGKDLWSLVQGTPWVDPGDLAEAVRIQAQEHGNDYRTRLLIRDSVNALRDYWGAEAWTHWLERNKVRDDIEEIFSEEFERVGFPTLRSRLMEKTDPELVRQFFRELSGHVHQPIRLPIGGSVALILPGFLSRGTEDIDVVNEVPAPIRDQHKLLNEYQRRYGLLLTHFQAHYLPSGWDKRLHYFDTFGSLRVYLVDVLDIFLGKLTSIRTKDLDDLRTLAPQLDKQTLSERMKETMESTFASAELRKRAQHNWYVLYGEDLPA
ncbi:MAG: hypothetical protein FJ271_24610 [Planctomycetes bacterium]|nr:hypothetical protein [Planctomycetota bacterium]